MNRRLFTILTALMWLALPLTALRYAQSWNELPAAVVTHFAANGQPNGWMSRATALYYALGVTAFVLVIFTAIALVIMKQKTAIDNVVHRDPGIFLRDPGGVFYVNNGIIEYNLTGAPVPIAPVLLGVPLAIVVFTIIYLRAPTRRRAPGNTDAGRRVAWLATVCRPVPGDCDHRVGGSVCDPAARRSHRHGACRRHSFC